MDASELEHDEDASRMPPASVRIAHVCEQKLVQLESAIATASCTSQLSALRQQRVEVRHLLKWAQSQPDYYADTPLDAGPSGL